VYARATGLTTNDVVFERADGLEALALEKLL
jgi:hypothetical protein